MRMIYRIRTNTVTLPRTFSNWERFLMTQEEAQRRCDASWWGSGVPRYQTTVLETYDYRVAYITYNKIKESLQWCEFDGEKTIIDEAILQRSQEEETPEKTYKGLWEVIDHTTAMPAFDYYMSEDGLIQGPDFEEISRKTKEAGGSSVHEYRIRNGEGWLVPQKKIEI